MAAVTLPNSPELVPPASAKLNAPAARPVIALPFLSFTTIVITSVLPDTTVGDAKLIVELAPLTPPATTWMVGLVVNVTPFTSAVSVLVEPAVVPVKTAV